MSGVPALSVVLATDCWAAVRTVVRTLQAQSERDRLELVLVTLRDHDVDPGAPELQGFAAVRVVEVPSLVPMGAARAAGVQAAAASVVFLGETHTYPRPGWAGALIGAHDESWGAVVPQIGNANPRGALSWAAFLLDYGRWFDGDRREVTHPPAYNAALRRDLLLEQGESLPALLEPGGDLVPALRDQGQRFLLEPDARIDHLNVSLPTHWLRERYVVGRLVAARRAQEWSRSRRALHCAGSPLVPPLLVLRIRRPIRAARRLGLLPRLAYPALVLAAAALALGELVGYVAGPSDRAERMLIEYELNKSGYVAEAE
jgi:hypothetical protein